MERVLNREGIRFLFAQVYSCQIYFLNENDEAAEHKIYVRHPILLPEAWVTPICLSMYAQLRSG